MVKKYLFIMLMLLNLLASIGFADNDSMHDFTDAKNILQEKKPLNQLSESELELIGDYFMELMVGDRHEFMDEMMGGEGSESLKQTHINIALNNYEQFLSTGTLSGMGMMGGGGMMGNYNNQYPYSGMMGGGVGMMSGNYNTMMSPGTGHGFFGFGFLGFFTMILFWAFIIWLIYWVIKNQSSTITRKDPKEVAKLRLANGEITKKEYEEMLKELDK